MPHHVLAMGTVLAALGAKAASAGMDPVTFISTGAGSLGKGMGSTMLAVKAGKAALGSAPAATSFLSHGGDAATDMVAAKGVSFLASKGPASAVSGAPSKALGGSFLAKGHAGSAVSTSLAKVGSGAGAVKPSFLKVAQKTCFAKRRMKGLRKSGKKMGKKVKRGAKKAKERMRNKARRTKKETGKQQDQRGNVSNNSQTQSDSSNGAGGGSSGNAQEEPSASLPSGSATAAAPAGSETAPVPTGSETIGAPAGEAEVMPGPLSSSAPASSPSAGFLQVHQASASTPVSGVHPTATTTTVTTTMAPTTAHAAHSSTAGAAAAAGTAAAAAADHAGDAASHVHSHLFSAQPHYDVSGGAEGGDPASSGIDMDDAADVADDEPGESRSKKLLGGLVRGAMGMETDEDAGLLHHISHRAGSRLFGSIFGGHSDVHQAAMVGAAGLGAAAAAVPGGGMEYMDPSVIQGDVEEESMGVTAVLPSLFSKLSLSRNSGNAAHERKTCRRGVVGKRHRRSPSPVSTTCSSDSCPSDSGVSTSPSARRVIRSHADGRKAVYADFLC